MRPERSFTVTGRPLPSTAPRAMATALSGSSSSDAPAPVLTTFLTGQPMLMSIRSAPASRAFSAAIFMTSGSCPNSWIETGCSSGWMRRNSRRVRLSPYLIPKLEPISDTARPAPWGRACMRMNQLPIPASGARIARFGRRTPPSSHSDVIGCCTSGNASAAPSPLASRPVAFPHEPQPGERQQVVDLVYALAEGRDRRGEAAGRDCGRLGFQLLADAADDAVDLAGEPVDDARPQGRLGTAADRGPRRFDLH